MVNNNDGRVSEWLITVTAGVWVVDNNDGRQYEWLIIVTGGHYPNH